MVLDMDVCDIKFRNNKRGRHFQCGVTCDFIDMVLTINYSIQFLCYKASLLPDLTNTIVFIILAAITRDKFHLSSIVINRVIIFSHVIYFPADAQSMLAQSANFSNNIAKDMESGLLDYCGRCNKHNGVGLKDIHLG